jgi:hypothetical protein
MPTNGEKRPRWLMGCKCGARVKASGDTARIAHFRADPKPICNTRSQMGTLGGNPDPIRQDCCGTMEVCSNADILTFGEGWLSPLRSNSIRRSKAVERIIG